MGVLFGVSFGGNVRRYVGDLLGVIVGVFFGVIFGAMFGVFLGVIEARSAGGMARPPRGKICPDEVHGIRQQKEAESAI